MSGYRFSARNLSLFAAGNWQGLIGNAWYHAFPIGPCQFPAAKAVRELCQSVSRTLPKCPENSPKALPELSQDSRGTPRILAETPQKRIGLMREPIHFFARANWESVPFFPNSNWEWAPFFPSSDWERPHFFARSHWEWAQFFCEI